MSVRVKCAKSLQEFASKDKVIVVGAGKLGKELIQHIEKLRGNVNNIIAIVDNDANLHGQFVFEIPIISMNEVSDECSDSVIVVAVKKYKHILNQMNKMKKFEDKDCYIYTLLKEGWIWDSDEELKWHQRISQYALLQYEKNLRMRGTPNKEQLMKEKQEELQKMEKAIVPKMVYIVTNKCTLRCKGCLGRVPYFENPQHKDVKNVLHDMDKFLECIDECITVEIAGGEPLLYPHLDILLDYLIQHDKVHGIGFTTNGTVVPDERVLQCLSHEKVWIDISDYGMLDKLSKVVYAFEQHNIRFNILSRLKWIEPGDLQKRGKTVERLEEEYADCWDAYNCKVIVDGRLFVCPRYARLYMQNVHNFEKDSILLEAGQEIETRKRAIFDLYLMDYAESCDYCDFASENKIFIEPGEQMGRSFYQSEYTIVKRKN